MRKVRERRITAARTNQNWSIRTRAIKANVGPKPESQKQQVAKEITFVANQEVKDTGREGKEVRWEGMAKEKDQEAKDAGREGKEVKRESTAKEKDQDLKVPKEDVERASRTM